jgi:predicted negative regulator of RcsB-dependent stress response
MSKSAHELTRKDLKGPDKFQETVGHAAGWATGHRKPLLLGLGAAAAAIVAALAILSWRESRAEKAGSLLFRSLAELTGQVKGAEDPFAPAGVPQFESEEAKQKAIVEATQRVQERFGGTRPAATAALVRADALYRLGDLDGALAGYRQFLDGASGDDSLRFAALDGVARAQEGKGQLDDAAKTWADAERISFYADRAAIERARVLARAGKADEAKGILQAFGDKHKESALKPEADALLARLGAPAR